MEPFVLREKEYFILEDWDRQFPNLTVGFTTKNGGNSKGDFTNLNVGFHVEDRKSTVCENRNQLAEKLAFPLAGWIGAQQTHEVKIKKATKYDKGKGANDYESAFGHTDGFFTFDSGILLTLCYADCVPLYFLHPESGAVGVAHAGWKGTVHGIAEEMIRTFQEEGLKVNDILVAIGPSICENCYIVDDHVIKLVENRLEGVERKPYNLISDHQYKLNLKECNKEILLNTGILEEHISMTNLCTSCQADHFFSHRRDQGKTGRMMSFIGWKEDIQ
ncbi:peptidoglycan editing factor PgeF [Bacillus sp. V3B]|uniref:peptidoglycan editing factor PgeF n=1 Tax=Bacillus sp. V3B TaxID=2804915 RepID=UPI00210ABA4B|nr:peptidoglycan editing factor PgeF [Bacillus sp. V3B]MCQ6274015.1 peptidoglycan editing factor PgeF [Bacillus sp. V3B]